MFGVFYRIGIEGYFLLAGILSLFNSKASLFIKGRKRTFSSLSEFSVKSGKRVWFHCASLGEFEQAKPVIEELKTQNPSVFIAVSFFSPSGYEVSQNYKYADWTGYLPKDTPRNARKFLKLLQPDMAVFVKYEFWYYFLKQLKHTSVPAFLISAKFYKGGVLNPFAKPFFLSLLKDFRQLFLQDKVSYQLLKKEGLTNIVLSGDTRIDRVLEIAAQEFDTKPFEPFTENAKVLIAGSSWQAEENLLLEAMQTFPETVKLIIAPHDIKRSKEIQRKFADFAPVLFSEWRQEATARVLILDSIGILSKLYRVADIALVGGGFSNALHNIFEPAVYGIPVLYGTRTAKYPEGQLLAEAGIGFPVSSAQEIENYTLAPEDFFEKVRRAASLYFDENKGVCAKVVSQLAMNN